MSATLTEVEAKLRAAMNAAKGLDDDCVHPGVIIGRCNECGDDVGCIV